MNKKQKAGAAQPKPQKNKQTPEKAGLSFAVIHPEFGMEGFYDIKVKDFPAIVAVANGETIFAK